jgi:hypothetical protein
MMLRLSMISLVAMVYLSSAAGTALAEHSRDFGGEIAGTYLATVNDDALILQLDRDGNMTVTFALQFLNLGVVGEDFSDTKGAWKRTGSRTIVAKSVDIAFDGPTLIGVGAARYEIAFDRHFRNAVLNCQGAIYPPGVEPFSNGAEPISGSEFECHTYMLHRIP